MALLATGLTALALGLPAAADGAQQGSASAAGTRAPSVTAPRAGATRSARSVLPAPTAVPSTVPGTTASSTVAGPSSTAPARPLTDPSSGVGRTDLRGSVTPGALEPGATAYPVPATAVHVSVTGNDYGAGTAADPVRTIAKGLSLAPDGGTVVVHAGAYHESVVTPSRRVVLQSAPHEEVWLDGSVPVTGWAKDPYADRWQVSGWATRFDASPTYTKGAADGTAPGWQFVNPSYPMAAHPDQVFVDGTALRQVTSVDQVTAGTFYLNESTSVLSIGTDPSGRTVEASTLSRGLRVLGAGSEVRGIGVRRYSPSVWQIGSVILEAPSVSLTDVVVEDSATTGVAVINADADLERVSIRRSGMLGLHARFADRLLLDRVASTDNNVERFNSAPVSGGAKIGATRGVRVTNSSFSGNLGQGFWEDLSVYDTVLAHSTFSDNLAAGIFLEISAKVVVVDNVVARNGGDGIKVNNTSDVRIWNNTILADGRALNLVQDARRNTNPNDQAVDPRQAFPDPTMPWTLGPVEVRNNVVSQLTSGANCLLCVEDYSREMTAEQMHVTSDGNLFHRPTASTPQWVVVWSRGATSVNPYVFTTLADATKVTGQDAHSRDLVGTDIVDAAGVLAHSVRSLVPDVARPMSGQVAAVIGIPAGLARVGVF